MKRLEKFLRPYRRESILAPLFKLLEVVFDLMVPVVVAQIIDVGVAKNDRGYIVEMFFVLLLMAAVGLLCSFTAQFFAAKASVGFATSVRQAMFDHIQRLSFTELDTLGTDTLITRLTDDVNQVQNGINMGLRLLLRSPFVVIGAMVMAFTINVRCALIFVVTVPILFVVVFSIMLISIPLFKKVQAGLDCVTGLTRENLTGVRVIRAFCREEQSVEEFEEGNRELTRLNEFVGRISALLNPLTYVLINGATVLLIARAGVQVNIGNLQQGQVVALYNYMAQIIVACLLFMIPVAKRRRFPARFASCTIVLLMIAYMFGAAVTVPDNLLLAILYWPAFAVICLPAVALCLQAGLSEVLYCTICANATQHAANECYLALSIASTARSSSCLHANSQCMDIIG